MAEFRGATAELKAALAEFRAASVEKICETIEFQAQLSELKGASVEQKAVIVLSLSQTITAIYAYFDYFAGVEAGLAVLAC
jgi:hypothetical protein